VLPPDLSLFLSAGIGVERSGMTLTVLSALARLDLDPWDEAGRLSKLSRREAADSFARSLATLPEMPHRLRGTAARLVALLPPCGSLRAASTGDPAAASLRAVRQRAAPPRDSPNVPRNAPDTARDDGARSAGSMTAGAGGRWPKQPCAACHTDGLRPCQAAQGCLGFYLCADLQRSA